MEKSVADFISAIKWRVETLNEQGMPDGEILESLLENFANYPNGVFWNKDWFCEEE